jgi:arsenate reductase
MAEGFARQLADNGETIYSAGTSPKGVHPLAIRVMQEVGIDISSQESKALDNIPLRQIGHIITLCGDAAESCATLPGGFTRTHWPLSDPAAAHGTEAEVLPQFRIVRDQIRERIAGLYSGR